MWWKNFELKQKIPFFFSTYRYFCILLNSDPHWRQNLYQDPQKKNAHPQLDLDGLKINADPLLSMRITNANFVSVTLFVPTNKDVEHSSMRGGE